MGLNPAKSQCESGGARDFVYIFTKSQASVVGLSQLHSSGAWTDCRNQPYEDPVPAPSERDMNREIVSSEMVGALHSSTGAYELVIGALAAALVGWAVDTVVGTTPLFVLLFAVIGFVGASYSIWLNYRTDMAEAAADRAVRAKGAR